MTTVSEHLDQDPWLAAIVGSFDDAIITKDFWGVTTSWNGAAERLLGYTAAEVIGQPIIVVFPLDRGEEESSVMERIGRGELVDRYETDRRHKDGHIIKVSIAISATKDTNGTIIGTSSILRDLTDRNARDQRIQDLEAELAHVRRLTEVGHFLSSLVHEASQPLTAIRNYVSACRLLAKNTGQDRVLAALERIAEQTDRTWEIVHRLQGFVKKSGVQMPGENSSQVMEDSTASARLTAKDESPTLTTKLDPPGLPIEINKVQVQ